MSECATEVALEEASARQTRLVVVHAWSDLKVTRYAGRGDFFHPVVENVTGAETALLAERLAGWQEKYPDVQIEPHVYLADPARRLLKWSSDAQLVVVGSRGRGGIVGPVLGSTSSSLVQHAYCTVMIVHQD